MPDTAYAFADFGPAGGAFNVVLNGPPFRLLGTAIIERTLATALSDCAHDAAELLKTDGMIVSAMNSMTLVDGSLELGEGTKDR